MPEGNKGIISVVMFQKKKNSIKGFPLVKDGEIWASKRAMTVVDWNSRTYKNPCSHYDTLENHKRERKKAS